MKIEASVDVGTNIAKLIEQLAHQLGTTADKVYPWYVKQQVIEGITSLTILVTLSLIFIPMFIWGYRKSLGDDDYVALTCMAGVVMFVVFLVVIFCGPGIASQIYNPDYHAIQALMRDAGKLIGK